MQGTIYSTVDEAEVMNMSKVVSFGLALILVTTAFMLTAPAYAQTVLGDTNVESVSSTFNAQYVEALTKITVTQSTTIQSVSMYLQYTGSDGSQCLKFGVYADNGAATYGQSSPLNEPLIAATHNGYCFVVGNFGPAWEKWQLQASDYLTLPAGTYWLAVLPAKSFGLIYHFTYTGLFPGQFLYNYGYFMYGFPASYALGFPTINFGANPYQYGSGNMILPYNSGNVGEYNAPYSFFVMSS